jgi:hypothetical protein
MERGSTLCLNPFFFPRVELRLNKVRSGPDGRRPIAVGRYIGLTNGVGGRKVRAPQDMAMGNTHRP